MPSCHLEEGIGSHQAPCLLHQIVFRYGSLLSAAREALYIHTYCNLDPLVVWANVPAGRKSRVSTQLLL